MTPRGQKPPKLTPLVKGVNLGGFDLGGKFWGGFDRGGYFGGF